MDCIGFTMDDFNPRGDRLCFLRERKVVSAGKA